MKKINLLILFLLSINILATAQSVNHNQVLADLIQTKKWFDIERYYQQHKDSINDEFVKLFYKAETSKVFNQTAQSIDAYEQLLDKNLLKMNSPELISRIGQPLLQICADEQEFAKAEKLCEKMITILQKDTVFDATAYIQGLETAAKTFKNWKNNITLPKVVDNNPNDIGAVQLTRDKSDNGIFFPAKWNDINLRTHFDTGAGGCFIANRAVAEKIGVKLNTTDTLMMNGNIKGLMGTVDSLCFGKFSIKNVPVFVNIEKIDHNNPRQAKCDSAMNSMFDIVLGMSVIRRLGIIAFDFEKNTMSFPKQRSKFNQPNICINAGTLYLNMKICDTDFLAYFDTGGHEGLSINTDFYQNHKQQILTESQATKVVGFVGGCNETSMYTRYVYNCPKIEIQINKQKITMTNNCAVAKDKENNNKYGTPEGGYLGNDIFKYCKKAVFDFENMIFSVNPKGTNR